MMEKFLLAPFLVIIFMHSVLGQDVIDLEKPILKNELIRNEVHFESETRTSFAPKSLIDFSEVLLEPIHSWNISVNPNSYLNFNYFSVPDPLGDINGDGRMDYYLNVDRAMDERTENILDDQVFKTAIFLGGNLSRVPDTVYYEIILPAGDLNNDGYDDVVSRSLFSYSFQEHEQIQVYFGSENGLVATGKYIEGTEEIETSRKSVSFVDLNGDDYEDVVFRADLIVEVLYGAADVDEMIFSSIPTTLRNYDTKFGNYTYIVGDLNENDNDDVIIIKGALDNNVIGVYEFQPSSIEERQIIQNFELEISSGSLKVIDINGDSTVELFIGDGKGLLLEVDQNGFLEETTTILNPGFDSAPIGDINKDNRVDFLMRDPDNTRNVYIGFGKESFDDGIQPDVLINEYYEDPNWRWSQLDVYGHKQFSDFDGDGIDDIFITHYEDSLKRTGKRIIFGSESGVFESKFVLEESRNVNETVFEVVGIGDLNSDGVQDFAFLKFASNEAHIFWGGKQIGKEADLIIELDYNPKKLIKGDFNGDTIDDIIIGDNLGIKANIYFGKPSFNGSLDKQLLYSEIQEMELGELGGLHFPEFIGDFNKDGIDDFIFNDLSRRVFLYLGGENIFSVPEYIIDLSEEIGEDFLTSNGFGFSNTALGDVNNDGFDDFAISDYNFRNENSTEGAVFVFFGSEKGLKKNVKLNLPDSLNEIRDFGYGVESGGDINGDGVNDLIISARYSNEHADNLFSIYYGGDNFNQVPDSSFGIKSELVGSFNSGNSEGYLSDFRGEAKFLDWESDGTFDVIVIPSLAFLYPIILSNSKKTIKLIPPNSLESLGNYYLFDNTAIGDFNDDGNIEIILPQVYDNNDSYQSSRIYMYSIDRSLVNSEPIEQISGFKLDQNYPNPFNPSTKISFNLPNASDVHLQVFNILGQEVANLIEKRLNAGRHSVDFNAHNLSSGVYIYRITIGGNIQTKKMLLIK